MRLSLGVVTCLVGRPTLGPGDEEEVAFVQARTAGELVEATDSDGAREAVAAAQQYHLMRPNERQAMLQTLLGSPFFSRCSISAALLS